MEPIIALAFLWLLIRFLEDLPRNEVEVRFSAAESAHRELTDILAGRRTMTVEELARFLRENHISSSSYPLAAAGSDDRYHRFAEWILAITKAGQLRSAQTAHKRCGLR